MVVVARRPEGEAECYDEVVDPGGGGEEGGDGHCHTVEGVEWRRDDVEEEEGEEDPGEVKDDCPGDCGKQAPLKHL